MASQDKGLPLPKFGEWDVNNPATAEGFTVIFNKARDEKKKTGSSAVKMVPSRNSHPVLNENYTQYSPKRKWFCCG